MSFNKKIASSKDDPEIIGSRDTKNPDSPKPSTSRQHPSGSQNSKHIKTMSNPENPGSSGIKDRDNLVTELYGLGNTLAEIYYDTEKATPYEKETSMKSEKEQNHKAAGARTSAGEPECPQSNKTSTSAYSFNKSCSNKRQEVIERMRVATRQKWQQAKEEESMKKALKKEENEKRERMNMVLAERGQLYDKYEERRYRLKAVLERNRQLEEKLEYQMYKLVAMKSKKTSHTGSTVCSRNSNSGGSIRKMNEKDVTINEVSNHKEQLTKDDISDPRCAIDIDPEVHDKVDNTNTKKIDKNKTKQGKQKADLIKTPTNLKNIEQIKPVYMKQTDILYVNEEENL